MPEPGGGKLSWEGVELIWVILGFLGAALGVGTLPPMSKKQLVTALISGVVAAGLAPQWAAFWWLRWAGGEIPAFMNNTIALFFGIGGMFIVPGAIVFWQTVKSNPLVIFDWIDRWRGRGPPAAPPPPAPPGDRS